MRTGHAFTKEARPTLRDRAVQQIKDAILSGKLKSGNRLIEQELSSEMGMSRFPVREAIASLECEGLVTIEPYKGAFISMPSKTEIAETYDIRELLELHALKLLMQRDRSEALGRLNAIVASMGDADGKRSNEDFLRNDFEFHETLCKMSGNAVLYRTWLTLSTKIQIFLNEELHQESLANMCQRHGQLCALIAAGDAETAAKELQNHLQRGKMTLLQRKEQVEQTG